jgi:hypothetical protein
LICAVGNGYADWQLDFNMNVPFGRLGANATVGAPRSPHEPVGLEQASHAPLVAHTPTPRPAGAGARRPRALAPVGR